MKKNITVYIASPYTVGDIAVNVRRQIDCVEHLMNLGFFPFAPLYSHFQHIFHPRNYETWMEVDMIWVSKCDALLRLSGESKGADREVELAKTLGIPVFYSIGELDREYNTF